MGTINARNYSCKDEELPAICKFAAFSLNRDLANFNAYSPRFNPDYLKGFETRIAATAEVIEPQSETQELKIINRKQIVQGNLAMLNELFGQLDEILRVRKILYKSTDETKLQEYTFSELKKRVHRKD